MDDEGIRRNVRATYDRIASHFAETRSGPWPEIITFLERADPASRAIDLGCGNGRHVPPLHTVADDVTGLDVSRPLLREARSELGEEGVDWVQGDAIALPFEDETFDLAIYVATLHHLPSRADRIASLDELARVMRPSALALVSVWSVAEERFEFEDGQDRTVAWTLPDGTTLDRYYHVFDEHEFVAELHGSDLDLDRVFESSGNLYARMKRPVG